MNFEQLFEDIGILSGDERSWQSSHDKAEKSFCWPNELSHLSCYLSTPELINELNVFCLIPQTMQKFTEVIESGTKSTHRFVIRFGISSLFIKLTKRSSPPADHMSWVISHIICWPQHRWRNWTYFVSLQEGSSNLLRQLTSGTKSTDSFVIRFRISSIFNQLTKPEVLLQTT